MTTRLAIVSSHPIQYNAPAFRCISELPDMDVRVFYGWEGLAGANDPEFGLPIQWDIPLLSGYDYLFLPNTSTRPGSHHFRGIDNPTAEREIRAWNPDALVIYGWCFATHLRILRKFHGRIPIIFRGDSTLMDETPGIHTTARRLFLRWVYSHVDHALYVGTLNRAYYHAHGLVDEQLTWGPHAVDNYRFSSGADDKEQLARSWRTRLGIRDDHRVVLFAAKTSIGKDPFTLLTAFLGAVQSSTGPPAHLIFAGDGELTPSLRSHASGYSNIHFLGFQNQTLMPVVYRLGDVIVLPSLSETWGLAINEAMACGRPAIVSDRVGCAPDLVRPGMTGYSFQHGSPESLRAVLNRFLNDKKHFDDMGLAASEMIARWSIGSFADSVSSALSTLLPCQGKLRQRGTVAL